MRWSTATMAAALLAIAGCADPSPRAQIVLAYDTFAAAAQTATDLYREGAMTGEQFARVRITCRVVLAGIREAERALHLAEMEPAGPGRDALSARAATGLRVATAALAELRQEIALAAARGPATQPAQEPDP